MQTGYETFPSAPAPPSWGGSDAVHQWLVCIVVAFAIVVAAEVRKALARRRDAAKDEAEEAAETGVSAVAAR
jgi:hypothetical protein